jgi:(p)ppGpp synthase/HD superfamily hydrolase
MRGSTSNEAAMADNVPPCPALLEAIAFAAQAHQHQLRKDQRTPYVSHAFRVCMIVRHLFGIEDQDALSAAVLHDTIEDTPKDYDDIAEHFGPTVAGYVAALTKDMRLPEEIREERYGETLSRSPWQVKMCKLADIYDNLTDSIHLNESQRRRSLQRSRSYLTALRTPDLPPPVLEAWNRTDQLQRKLGGPIS